MTLDVKKLLDIAKRGDAISAQMKIALLEFDAAIQAEDPKKQEEIRVKIHQLTDDQLDLQVDVKHIRDAHTEEILNRIKGKFK